MYTNNKPYYSCTIIVASHENILGGYLIANLFKSFKENKFKLNS